jgi:hypothetical protein
VFGWMVEVTLDRVYPSTAPLCTMGPVTKLVGASSLVALALTALSSPAPATGSCSAECDRKAAECVDTCEAKHKDAGSRVECKLACIATREKCEKGCN